MFLDTVDWSSIFSQKDVNLIVDSFNEILLAGINLYTPIKYITSSSFPRWFSKDMKILLCEKKKAHLLFKNTNLQSDYDRFQLLRAQCKFLSRECYERYLDDVSRKIKSDPRFFWRYSDETRKIGGFPKNMFFVNSTSSNSQRTADLFAESFSSVYIGSDSSIPKYPMLDVIDFNLCSFCADQVFKKLVSLPPKFSSGPDNIPPFILKKCASRLASPLSYIFNLSLSSGVFPAVWKSSFVLPIFKSGERSNIANYRGVCIQSSVPKVLDSLIYDSLSFASKHFIVNQQHGFVAGRSTVTNLLCYQHDIIRAFDSGVDVHSVYTDVAKAFDRVNTEFLVAKLKSYGIGDSFLRWLSHYLSDRVQYVKLGALFLIQFKFYQELAKAVI